MTTTAPGTATATTLVGHWIDGAGVPVDQTRTAPVFNPATGAEIGRVALANQSETAAAVSSAVAAQLTWGALSIGKRAGVLFRFRELLAAHADELAAVISREHGKVFSDARGEVARGLEVVEYACGLPQLMKGELSDEAATGIEVFTTREPLGVVVGITPFNFPAMVPLWMSPVAIATGNAFILKPSERDPSAANVLARLWQQAGLPDGVFTVLHGDKDTVTALLEHPDVAAVSFVGSTPIARHVHATATATGKRVQALGGAKNHGVILADADLEDAADHLTAAAFGSAGERCMALSVAVVTDEVADELVSLLADRARAVKVAPGDQPDADMGPVITAAAKERIEGLISSAEREGADLVVDGRGLQVEGHEEGFFVGPTLIDNVSPEHQVYREEVFGPVLDIVRVSGLDEAIELVNANPYGNGTAIFTASGAAAREYRRRVKVGMVGVNVPIPVPVAWHSFGGWKDSLFGDSPIYGPEGVNFYTRPKVTTQRWPARAVAASFHFSGDSEK
ncbi:CoA-acylating methylmalonate-semialdehyde dehydrogenase [Pseudactinotalea suaedae]|uniref:CoA-acylating methylmalonate-semialdehyde dehydrogenase n=1 Tax=Pseudactinotalea suaedae TaxID=1524924 RepID=UPI0012E2A0E5|nr:CoA-acylating methylmalonate-semialdehyde dehydrogenase [Pseudactinotalea suaedae]